MDSSLSTAIETTDEGTLGVILGVLASFSIVLIIVAIIWYVLSAIGFYRMAKNRNLDYPWIAWIPICQNYLMGDIIGNEVWGFGYANWILVIGQIISSVVGYFGSNLSGFPLILFGIYSIVFYVYYMTALYKLYKVYSTKAVVMIVTTIIFPFLASIYIFAIREHKPLELN